MIKLEAISTKYPTGMSAVFYFHNMNDCNIFMHVFKDHWCNVKWEMPIELPDNTKIPDYKRRDMDKNAKERAERSLPWGFAFAINAGTDISIITQSMIAERLANKITEENK